MFVMFLVTNYTDEFFEYSGYFMKAAYKAVYQTMGVTNKYDQRVDETQQATT